MTARPLLNSKTQGERLELAAAGAWTAEHENELEPLVDAVTQARSQVRSVAIDMAQVERLDTFGAWLLQRVLRAWNARGCETTIVGLREHHRGLVEKVQAATQVPPPAGIRPNPIIATLDHVGRAMV